MPPARTPLNARNLEGLGAEKLASLLLELSEGNGAAKRRLRLALAEGRSAEDAAQEVRKRLKTIERSSTFLDSARRKTLLTELEGHLATISGSICGDNPALALDLHWNLLELSEGIFDRCHDGNGAVGGFFARVLEALPASLQAASPQPAATAERLVDALQDCNGYGQLDQAVAVLAEALGRDGLEAVRRECAERGVPAGAPVLLAVADALGDVESFVAAFDTQALQRPATAAAVANRLLKAGRAEEALAVATGARRAGPQGLGDVLSTPQIAALEALGRGEEAQALRWQCFLAELSASRLRDYLQRLPDFEDLEAEEKALDLVQAHPHHHGALRFLLAWPHHRRAAALVLSQLTVWDGEAFELYGPAAEQLEADHPLAATALLRAMVTFALETGRARRYRYAAQHLRHCAELADRIDSWNPLPPHGLYDAELRRAFGRTTGFWELVNEPM